jgi:hypothetical protein
MMDISQIQHDINRARALRRAKLWAGHVPLLLLCLPAVFEAVAAGDQGAILRVGIAAVFGWFIGLLLSPDFIDSSAGRELQAIGRWLVVLPTLISLVMAITSPASGNVYQVVLGCACLAYWIYRLPRLIDLKQVAAHLKP